MKTPALDLLHRAYGKFGIAAFNVFTAEQIHGVFGGAADAQIPIIVQVTPAARNYLHPGFIEGLITAAATIYYSTDFSMHLDHGNMEHCLDAIESGFYDSVMIDASHENFETNIAMTSEIVARAHANGIAVEAELGVLRGIEDDLNVSDEKARYTDPRQVVEFVERTKADSLAVAVGTSHGAYKFSGNSGLQIDILKEIQQQLPGFPIVLHGASNVPQSEITRINQAGGKIKSSAKGVDEHELLEAIAYGVTKINIATDMRLIWARVHREFFGQTPEQFDPILPGKKYIEELKVFVKQKCQSLILASNEH
ncbi:MAG TPA: class II fructose-bisphosphate aldolase [Bacteroidota bacterium]|nr:class II fructose-bisphosphate aldolase [Bacteroidota bacterium]